jgi:hypothetical protein
MSQSKRDFDFGFYAKNNPDVIGLLGNDDEKLWDHYKKCVAKNKEQRLFRFNAPSLTPKQESKLIKDKKLKLMTDNIDEKNKLIAQKNEDARLQQMQLAATQKEAEFKREVRAFMAKKADNLGIDVGDLIAHLNDIKNNLVKYDERLFQIELKTAQLSNENTEHKKQSLSSSMMTNNFHIDRKMKTKSVL